MPDKSSPSRSPKENPSEVQLIPPVNIETRIFLIRGLRVLMDRDLAQLYGVKTKVLNQAVNRNIKRFPQDFMFRLTQCERDELVTNCDRFKTLKHSTVMPRVFTQEGVAMLSSVLNSERAIQVNIQIMRTFIKMRKMFSPHLTREEFEYFKQSILEKIEKIETKYDDQ